MQNKFKTNRQFWSLHILLMLRREWWSWRSHNWLYTTLFLNLNISFPYVKLPSLLLYIISTKYLTWPINNSKITIEFFFPKISHDGMPKKSEFRHNVINYWFVKYLICHIELKEKELSCIDNYTGVDIWTTLKSSPNDLCLLFIKI